MLFRSDDVNAYLQEISGQEFTAKDFRTWAGTILAARALQQADGSDSEAQAKKNVVQAVDAVAERLGNTRTVCRRCYIHPAIVDAYIDGSLRATLERRPEQGAAESNAELRPEEAAVLALLQQRLAHQAADHQSGGGPAQKAS